MGGGKKTTYFEFKRKKFEGNLFIQIKKVLGLTLRMERQKTRIGRRKRS
jgi:hypothetical protein